MNDKNVIINGELFVKNGPHIFNAEESLYDLREDIHNLEYETSLENASLSSLNKLDALSELNDQFSSLDGQLDYSGADSFWQIVTNGEVYELRQVVQYSFETPMVLTYHSLEELKKDFTSLRDFLSIAKFVGQAFYRTKPVLSGTGKDDTSFIPLGLPDIDCEYILLYATQELFLVEQIPSPSESKMNIEPRLILINSRYTLDGNYKFYGVVHKKYQDKKLLYQEILKQIRLDKQKGKTKWNR